jgi:hypothetical protein
LIVCDAFYFIDLPLFHLTGLFRRDF